MADLSTLGEEYAPAVETTLDESIVDFWYPRCIDEEHGGYVTSYDAAGDFAGTSEKQIVTQARFVWFFSRLDREGYGDYREAAEQGLEFILEEMWDDEHGGFYWQVERDGTVTKPNKHMYGQSFGLYALAEFDRAFDSGLSTGSNQAREYADELVELFDAEAHDEDNGGYVEYFEPDWTPILEGRTYLDGIEPDWSTKESEDEELDASFKLMNTHIHLMESFTEYHRATGDGADQLEELLHICTNTVFRKGVGACTDKYEPDWEPQLGDLALASYGHDLENVWLVMDAVEALGLSQELFEDFYTTLWDYSLEYGYDEDHGGFYFFGPLGEPATNRVKAWWVQAEVLTSALRMYELTGEERYAEVFEETWSFIQSYQIDHDVGEWHSGVTEDLDPVGRKGALYKGAYHNGRAMIECLDLLAAE
ncbi:AGE family epimerase/isomerase [Salinarchaeum laminariae]|uniref:AGE family epimerase/isomerase n=1 Tax=Salinarchaeum laminariae TaxID=869888 RepID=UPI0020BD4BEB|nr:AGE family epimerase/isomerase [Salinarchaeum laminariae]